MRNAIRSATTLVSILLLVGVLSACTTSDPKTVQQSDTDSITIEQVLDQARLAASQITSFKTRGSSTGRTSTVGFEEPTLDFNEYSSSGDTNSRMETPDSGHGAHTSKWRTVGAQTFSFHSGEGRNYSAEGWKEDSVRRTRRTSDSVSDGLLSMLDRDDIRLRSTDEKNEAGTEVYRLEYSEHGGRATREGTYWVQQTDYTALISKESLLVVSWTVDTRVDIYPVTAASDINSETHSTWGENFNTVAYYDFNVPIVIEAPESYIPSAELVVKN